MLITITEDRIGNVIAAPVSSRIARAMLADARKNGAPEHWRPELFMQQPTAEDVRDTLGPRALWRNEVNDGACIRIDEWTFRHMIGYAAD